MTAPQQMHDISISLADRLAAFDNEGTLGRDAAELWELLGDHTRELSAEFWNHYCRLTGIEHLWNDSQKEQALDRGVLYLRTYLMAPTEPGWVPLAMELVAAQRKANVSAATLLGAMNSCHRRMVAIVMKKIGEDL